ncbi:MAG: helix-turn-helix domain-containing protein [Saprospiraceae bacterium]|nr:helix-turn-helix domain-containing protein [Saprospiraceae bacterium]
MELQIFSKEEIQKLIEATARRTAEEMVERLQREPDVPPGESEPLKYLTKPQAAKLLGCSQGSLDGWARQGLLTRHKVGGGRAVRYDRSELMQLVGLKGRRK